MTWPTVVTATVVDDFTMVIDETWTVADEGGEVTGVPPVGVPWATAESLIDWLATSAAVTV